MSQAETAPASPAATVVVPAILSRAAQAEVVYRQRFVPHTANLKFLSCGEFSVPPGATSVTFCRPGEESLLFMWKATATVDVGGASHALATYDTLYVPRGAAFRLHNPGTEPAVLVHCSAPADRVHPVFHSRASGTGPSHGLITYRREGTELTLFQRRSREKQIAPGLFDVSVGGHYAAGEDAMSAGPREIREELGLAVPFEPREEDRAALAASSERSDLDLLDLHRATLFVLARDEAAALRAVRVLERALGREEGPLAEPARLLLARAADAEFIEVRRRAFAILVGLERETRFPATLRRFLDAPGLVLDAEIRA